VSGFISQAESFQRLIASIVQVPSLHARWINTLSFLENCGARKIAAYEHPTLVKEEILKHAAEEFRHAYHLKRQIAKITADPFETYAQPLLLGGLRTIRYLDALEVQAARHSHYLYPLITYAIELRAQEVYTLYQEQLRASSSKVSVKAILLEEHEHLAEMTRAIESLPNGKVHAAQVCQIEGELCHRWLQSIQIELGETLCKS